MKSVSNRFPARWLALACAFAACAPAATSSFACACSAAATATEAAPKGHPLKGVVVSVLAEKSALLVKHEEIPGVMKAMTMLLKVDAEALKAVRAGDAVTGLLVRKADGWWLDAVAKAP